MGSLPMLIYSNLKALHKIQGIHTNVSKNMRAHIFLGLSARTFVKLISSDDSSELPEIGVTDCLFKY